MNIIRRVGLMAIRKPIGQNSRKLYTDTIYPYPFKYVNSKWPSQFRYRETFPPTAWARSDHIIGETGMVLFWTYLWCMLFANPDVLSGHFHQPDPMDFTDQELGIPPDDVGPYHEWLAKRESQ